MPNLAVVTIGRNEGDRLIRCLHSLLAQVPAGVPIVYVDSGSTDGSDVAAKALGVEVIQLDLSIPFTMARGRNAGFKHLVAQHPDIDYVQFVDGDCELIAGWMERAIATLDGDEKIAAVCGRRRERFPEASIYNRLADLEWNTPVGEAMACGGDALIRVRAIQQVGGYTESLIAGEEPEMCLRMRQLGWKIQRIEADMTLHDAAMTAFGQWWKRMIRSGWATAAGTDLHGASSERYMVKESRSCWLWAVGIPLVAIALFPWTSGLSLLLFGLYGLLAWKIYKYRCSRGDTAKDAGIYAIFCVVGKFAEAIGQVRYWWMRWRGQQATLIEYKAPPS
jgi:GT2 family glycosyltransferase